MKAMQKTSRGSGFRGTLNYTLDHDDAKVIGGNMSGNTARDLSREFAAVYQSRRDCKKPVWHQSLRLPSGEHISDQKWNDIAEKYMKKMGFDEDHPYSIIKHDKSDGEHIHVVASRVSLSGKLFYGKDENLLSTKIVAQLEKEFGLTVTTTQKIDPATDLPSTKSDKSKLKRGEVEKALASGLQPARLTIQNEIDAALTKASNIDELERLLSKKDITVLKYEKDNQLKGLSFSLGSSKFSGTQLGEDYKFNSINKRMLENVKNSTSYATPDATRDQQSTSVSNTSNRENQQSKQQVSRNSENGNTVNKEATTIRNTTTNKMETVLDENSETCFISSSRSTKNNYKIPNLNNKLENRTCANDSNAFDLYFANREKPTFRFHQDSQQIQLLAKPNDNNTRAILELAREQKLGEPLQIFGTTEFQRMLCAEARKAGINVEPSDDRIQIEHRQALEKEAENNRNMIIAANEQQQREQQEREAQKLAELAKVWEKEDAQKAKNEAIGIQKHK